MTTRKKTIGARGLVAMALMAAAAGCGAGGTEDVGVLRVALQAAPADGLCLKLTIDAAPDVTQVKSFTLTAGQASQFTLTQLPLGDVGIKGEAFGVACASVVAATPITWTSDRVVVNLVPDFAPTLTLLLKKTARVNLGVDFVMNAQIDEVKLSGQPQKLAAAPDGSVLITTTINQVVRASTPFDAKVVAATPGTARFIATAADGTIFVGVNGSTIAPFTAAGVAKPTFTVPFTIGDLLVDPSNTLWIGSSSSPQYGRVGTATTTPSAPMIFPTPGQAASGLALAADGTVRAVSQPNYIMSLPAAGGSPTILSTAGAGNLRDLTVATDGALWLVGSMGTIQKLVGTAMIPIPGAAAPEVSLATSPRGVVVSLATGQLLIGQPDGLIIMLPLPGNPQVSSIAVAKNGKIWVTDVLRSRVLVVTLP
jgi:streptogramin lyase